MKTNREHFSWSQYDLWNRSKREYWKRYHLGAVQRSNKFFDKGKELATFIETGEEIGKGGDPMLKAVTDKLPRLGVPEQEVSFNVSVSGVDKKVLCFVDSGSLSGTRFIEYKTGKIPWTQEKVDEHDQMLFYALAYYKKFDVIPTSELVWVETMDTNDGLLYTGAVTIFPRVFATKEVKDFEKKVIATIKEIDDYEYKELEINESEVERYASLQRIVDSALEEMSEIKMKVQIQMMDADVTFGKGSRGNFIIQNRKVWNYSEYVAEMKKDVSKQQKLEQKEKTATYTESQSIMFKLNK
jgi:hypothetical protein